MKRRILVGASWKSGRKSIPESPGCFCKRIAECRHCKSLQGPFPSLMGDRKSLQQQKGAYVPHSHKLALFCYFTYFLCSANVLKSSLCFLKSSLCF